MWGQTARGFFLSLSLPSLRSFFYLPGTLLLFHVFRFLSTHTPAEDIKAKRAAEMDVNLSSSLICEEKNTHTSTQPTAVMDRGCGNWQTHKLWPSGLKREDKSNRAALKERVDKKQKKSQVRRWEIHTYVNQLMQQRMRTLMRELAGRFLAPNRAFI